MKLRRTFGPRVLAKGKSGGRLPLTRVDQLTDRERAKVEKLSHKLGSVAVLDEARRCVGHFAIDGIFALDAREAMSEDGIWVLDTDFCDAYPVAFICARGQWMRPDEWFEVRPIPLMHLRVDG